MTKSTTLYYNNARTTLSANITAAATTIPVFDVSPFTPVIGTNQNFFVTLTDGVNVETVQVNGISGETLTGCVRGYGSTSAYAFTAATTKVENRLVAENIQAFARLQDRVANVNYITYLQDATTLDGNSYLIGLNTDAGGNALFCWATGSLWSFSNFPILQYSGTVGSGSTTTSITLANANTIMTDPEPGSYIVQFTSGTYLGQCRLVFGITSSAFGWSSGAPLAGSPSPSDTYHIYRYFGYNITSKIDRTLTLPDDFNAPIDGVTDCHAALTNALNSGFLVDGCGLTYALNTPIYATGAGKLKNCTINVSGMTATAYQPAITFTGTFGAGVALTANSQPDYVTVGNSASFHEDQLVYLNSTQLWSIDQFGAYSAIGYLSKVRKIPSGTQVVLDEYLPYPITTAYSGTITPINNIDGISFTDVSWVGVYFDTPTALGAAGSGLGAIQFQNCTNITISGGNVTGINYAAFTFSYCSGVIIKDVHFNEARTIGHGNGVLGSNACSYFSIHHNVFRNLQRPVLFQCANTISRCVNISNNNIISAINFGVMGDCECDVFTISNNQINIYGDPTQTGAVRGTGVIYNGGNGIISNNQIELGLFAAVSCQYRASVLGSLQILGNVFQSNRNSTTSDQVILVSSDSQSGGKIVGLNICDNIATGSAGIGITVQTTYNDIIDSNINCNSFVQLSTTTVGLNVICNASYSYTNLYDMRILSNSFSSTGAYGISVVCAPGSNIARVIVKDSLIYGVTTAGVFFNNTPSCDVSNISLDTVSSGVTSHAYTGSFPPSVNGRLIGSVTEGVINVSTGGYYQFTCGVYGANTGINQIAWSVPPTLTTGLFIYATPNASGSVLVSLFNPTSSTITVPAGVWTVFVQNSGI